MQKNNLSNPLLNSVWYLFGVLYTSSLRVSVPKVYKLLQLTGPKSSYAFFVYLYQAEVEVSDIQHDDFVIISVVVDDMSGKSRSVNHFTWASKLNEQHAYKNG